MSKTLELAKQLISRQSVSPEDAGCQDILIERLEKIGFVIDKLPFADVKNFWARRGDKGPLFVFAGHTDVVPPGPTELWNNDPFTPTEVDGMLYGRGAADMKSSLAAMVTAVENFIAENPNHPGSIGFLITSDEEAAATNGTVKVVEHLQNQGIKVDYCLVGEATSDKQFGDTIKNGRRGTLSGKLKIFGTQGHIAYPHLCDNPIHRSAKIIDALVNTVWDEGNDHFSPTSFQISNIHAGTGANNVIPGELELLFNFRFSTESTAENLKNLAENIVNKHDVRFNIEWSTSGDPFLTTTATLSQALSKSITAITGINPALSTSGGTSDGRFIAKMGCEVVEFGPINNSIHKVNEHICSKDLEKLSQIYQQTLSLILR